MEAVHLYGGAKVELYGGCMVEISQCISKKKLKNIHALDGCACTSEITCLFFNIRHANVQYSQPGYLYKKCIGFWSECFEALPATITNSYLIQTRSQSRFGTTSAESIQTKTGSRYLN